MLLLTVPPGFVWSGSENDQGSLRQVPTQVSVGPVRSRPARTSGPATPVQLPVVACASPSYLTERH